MKDATPGQSFLEDLEKRVGDLEEMTKTHELFIDMFIIGGFILVGFFVVGVLWL